MAELRRAVPKNWANKPASKKMPPKAVEAIARRRRQMLIHSYLYYHADSPIIDDHTWTKWAQQLFQLQQKFGWRIGFYDAVFADWNGSSGHHLPTDADIVRVARRVHDDYREREYLLS